MTNSYMITCCSTADLPASYLAERDIPYSCFHFRMNGMEYDDDLGKSIPIEDFYENIRQGAMPTTSQVNPEQYEAMFEPILKEGKDIIHMTLS
ncbi:MAG: DegV family protein, partial [Enterocloster sp.]